MNTIQLGTRGLIALGAAALLLLPASLASAKPPASGTPALHSCRAPVAGAYDHILGVPPNVAVWLRPSRAKPERTVLAYSVANRCWLEVQPPGVPSVESIRAALAQSEVRFAAEEAARRQAAELARQQELQAQWQREFENYERRTRLMRAAASQPSGAGLIDLVSAGRGPTSINTTTRSTRPPTTIICGGSRPPANTPTDPRRQAAFLNPKPGGCPNPRR